MLHVHVLLVAPLGAGHMAQSGADQHEGGVAVRETAYHPSAAADLPVQPFNDIIGTDAGPMFTGEIAVSQRFLNAILHLPGRLFQLHRAQLLHHGFGFLPGRSFAFLGVDRLEHLCHQLYLGARRCREDVAVMVCRDFTLPEGCKLCPFLFAKLILPDPRSWPFGLPIDFITESRWKAWF